MYLRLILSHVSWAYFTKVSKIPRKILKDKWKILEQDKTELPFEATKYTILKIKESFFISVIKFFVLDKNE